jgi:glycogen debranching enzyme
MTEHGMINQSWMDSFDSFYFEDGRLFDPDLSRVTVEVQGYTYDALLGTADLFSVFEDQPWSTNNDPSHLRALAAQLRERVLDEFWLEDEGTLASAGVVGPDGALQISRVVGSNPGHLLTTRVLDGVEFDGQRHQVVHRLLQPDLLAGAGIRTKSTRAARFQPGSYHSGSTWPMDTGFIADGMRRHRYIREAEDLENRILHACSRIGKFPEFFRGEIDGSIAVNRRIVDIVEPDGRRNRLEQPPQWIQGWTVTRIWRILRDRAAALSLESSRT